MTQEQARCSAKVRSTSRIPVVAQIIGPVDAGSVHQRIHAGQVADIPGAVEWIAFEVVGGAHRQPVHEGVAGQWCERRTSVGASPNTAVRTGRGDEDDVPAGHHAGDVQSEQILDAELSPRRAAVCRTDETCQRASRME